MNTKPPVPNVKRLRRILRMIEDNPKCWNQGRWHCGTAHCFGGHAEVLAGYTKFDNNNAQRTRQRARRYLGLTFAQGLLLFQEKNSLCQLQDIVSMLCGDRGTVQVRSREVYHNGVDVLDNLADEGPWGCKTMYDATRYVRANGHDLDGLDEFNNVVKKFN